MSIHTIKQEINISAFAFCVKARAKMLPKETGEFAGGVGGALITV